MEVDNDIEYVMKDILKNQILSLLREIKIGTILKKNNFVYMLVINKHQSTFVKKVMMPMVKIHITDLSSPNIKTGVSYYS